MQRRLLMAIVNAFKWLAQSFTNLYNSLIPTTISGKSVKNKAKISKDYGNSVVENQLVENGNFVMDSGWYSTSSYYSSNVANNTYSITKITSGNGLLCYKANSDVNYSLNHKLLAVTKIKPSRNFKCYFRLSTYQSPQTMIANVWNVLTFLYTPTSYSGIYFGIAEDNNELQINDTVDFKEIMLFDLTQMFPFDTPTTLTDPRVQALLNRGYIEYNTGEIKSVDISEFSSEPYNLFDEEFEIGYLNTYGNYTPSNTDILSKNFQEVLPNRTYVINADNFTHTSVFVCEYDKDKNYISGTRVNITSTHKFTSTSQTRYIKFWFYSGGTTYTEPPANPKAYLTLESSRTGYAPHTQPQTLPFIYQGNGVGTSHDTFEITNSEYVFTKNIGSVDLGTLNYTYQTQQQRFYSNGIKGKNPDNNADYIPNMLSNYFIANSINGISENQITYFNNLFFVKGSALGTTNQEARAYLSGKYLYYELATPQVIRIPKKHLGIVDMGTLSYASLGSGTFSITTDIGKTTSNNLYVSSLITTDFNSLYSQSVDVCIARATNGKIWLYNSAFASLTNQQIKQTLAGVYLWYETESEVADIEDMIKVEAGGTLTSDSNVLPNVDMEVKCK